MMCTGIVLTPEPHASRRRAYDNVFKTQGRDLEKYLLRELSVLKYIRHQNMLEYIG